VSDFTGGARAAAGALFTADLVQFLPYVLIDIRRWQLRGEGRAIVEDDRLRGEHRRTIPLA
jgi:hypothetical protein